LRALDAPPVPPAEQIILRSEYFCTRAYTDEGQTPPVAGAAFSTVTVATGSGLGIAGENPRQLVALAFQQVVMMVRAFRRTWSAAAPENLTIPLK
jgi:hypothetical protein